MLAAVLPSVFKVAGVDSRGRRHAAGSAFLVSSDGLALTNAHVMRGVAASGAVALVALLDDGRAFTLEAVAMDTEADVAVIRLVAPPGAPPFPHLTLASSSSLRLGDPLAVLGAPLGGSVVPACGHFSGRKLVADDDSMMASDGSSSSSASSSQLQLLQVDTSGFASGSSGGPIVNSDGEVVGIATLVQTGFPFFSVGSTSFGVAAEQAGAVANALLSHGVALRPWIGAGIASVDAVSAEWEHASSGGAVTLLPEGEAVGILITALARNSPARRVGLEEGDVILSINGVRVAHKGDLIRAMGPVWGEGAAPDIALRVWRGGRGGGGGGVLDLAPFQPVARPGGGGAAVIRRRGW